MPADEPETAAPHALDAWVRETWSRAVAYAASLLRDRGAAEDVVHDCYCALLRNAGGYDLPRDGNRLLFKAVTNGCFKRNSREKPLVSLSPFEGLNGDGVPDRRAADPPRAAVANEPDAAIGAALGRLPPAQRAALELKTLGHSLQDIADALETSSTNAGVLVHRARRAMAWHLSVHLAERPG